MFGGGAVKHEVEAGFRQAGRCGYITDCAAFGAVAIESALRSAKHLDPLQIRQLRLGRTLIKKVLGGDGYVVQIEPDRRRSRRGADSANGDVGGSFSAVGIKRDTRNHAAEIIEVSDAVRLQILAAKR